MNNKQIGKDFIEMIHLSYRRIPGIRITISFMALYLLVAVVVFVLSRVFYVQVAPRAWWTPDDDIGGLLTLLDLAIGLYPVLLVWFAIGSREQRIGRKYHEHCMRMSYIDNIYLIEKVSDYDEAVADAERLGKYHMYCRGSYNDIKIKPILDKLTQRHNIAKIASSISLVAMITIAAISGYVLAVNCHRTISSSEVETLFKAMKSLSTAPVLSIAIIYIIRLIFGEYVPDRTKQYADRELVEKLKSYKKEREHILGGIK